MPCRRAFTLIELLAVIAIILVLLALLIPVIGRVRAQARQTECASRLRQVGMVVMAYRSDYHRLPQVEGILSYVFPHVVAATATPNLANLFTDYADSAVKIFYCPANAQYRTEKTHWPTPTLAQFSMTYGLTSFARAANFLVPVPEFTSLPASTLLLSDFYATNDLGRSSGVVWNHDTGRGADGMNELFGDGRVEWHPATGTWTCWYRDPSSGYYWWALDWPQ
jgi:prepilin-type N-terminal cleavage/methylation domain-containing protein